MGASVNKAIIIGNLGKDPILAKTSGGTTTCKFSVATSEKYKDEEKTTWHNVVTFGKTADNCGKYLSKGKTVYVEGRIDNRSYEKDGQTKFFSEIVADRVQFLSQKSSGSSSSDDAFDDAPPPTDNDAPPPTSSAGNDDLPF